MEISTLLKNKLADVIDLSNQFNTAIKTLEFNDSDGISNCQTLLSNILYRFNSFVVLYNELNHALTIEDNITNS